MGKKITIKSIFITPSLYFVYKPGLRLVGCTLPPPLTNAQADILNSTHARCVLTIYVDDKSAIRTSGLIPVIPLIVINKDTQLPMYIEEQAINCWWSGRVHYSYLYQPDNIRYVLYYTKYEQKYLRPSPATRGGRATGIISEIC